MITDATHDYWYINNVNGVGWLVPCVGAAVLFAGWIFGAPWDQWADPSSERSEADDFTIGAWWFVIGQVAVEALLAASALATSSFASGGAGQTLAEWLDKSTQPTGLSKAELACPLLKSFSGMLSFLAGMVAARAQYENEENQEDYSWRTATALWLTPIPALTRVGLVPARTANFTPAKPLAVAYQVWQVGVADLGINFFTGLLLWLQAGEFQEGASPASSSAAPALQSDPTPVPA
jgi:hypothetical protein